MKWNEVGKLKSGEVVGHFTKRGRLISVLIVLERPRRDERLNVLRAECFDLFSAELRMSDQHELAECERVGEAATA